jgi:hypothetical protein
MPMTGFFCQDDYLKKMVKLTDEEVGRLFRALMVYHTTGEAADLDGRESIAFDFIRDDIDKAEDAYQKKCDQARENRRKGLTSEATDDNARQRPSTAVNGSDHNNINKRDINKKNKEINVLFERFWSAYPRHVAKQEALKRFEKLNPSEELLETMLKAIEKQKGSEQWTKDNGQYIPHPSTWLNQSRWEDELPAAGASGKIVNAQGYSQRNYEDEDAAALERMLRGVTA